MNYQVLPIHAGRTGQVLATPAAKADIENRGVVLTNKPRRDRNPTQRRRALEVPYTPVIVSQC